MNAHNWTPEIARHLASLACMVILSLALNGAAAAQTVIVSQSLDPTEGGNDSVFPTPALSADGRTVAFTSRAYNLTDPIPNVNDDNLDIYVRDLLLGTTLRASDPADGGDFANGNSTAPSISANGRIVAFASSASDLIPDDPIGPSTNVYLRDLDSGEIERISLAVDGVSAPNGRSASPHLSADGRMVAFTSYASDLVAGDMDDNNRRHIFVRDRQTSDTVKITQGANQSSQSPRLSADGRNVLFLSTASNLVPDDGNGYFEDVFVHDLDTGITQLVSVTDDELSADWYTQFATFSGNGRYVAFVSSASNLFEGDSNERSDLFVRDLQAGTTTLVVRGHDGSLANDHMYNPCISDDGSVIAFHSDATNLVPDDANGDIRDVFVHERSTGRLYLANRALDGGSGNATAENCGISGDGRYVAYESVSTNLVEFDPNGAINDIFRSDAGDRIFAHGFE